MTTADSRMNELNEILARLLARARLVSETLATDEPIDPGDAIEWARDLADDILTLHDAGQL